MSFLAMLCIAMLCLQQCGANVSTPGGASAVDTSPNDTSDSGSSDDSNDNSVDIEGGDSGNDGGVAGIPDSGGTPLVYLEFINDTLDSYDTNDFDSSGGVTYHGNSRGSGTVAGFDGVDDYVFYDIANGATFNMNVSNFSISFWFATSATGTQFLLHQRLAGVNRDFFLIRLDGGTLTASYQVDWPNACNTVTIASTTTDLNDGKWHHVAFVRNGRRTGQLYIDNVLEAQDSNSCGSSGGINPINTSLFLGQDTDGGNRFTGYMDDFLWVKDKVFNSTDVDDLFNR